VEAGVEEDDLDVGVDLDGEVYEDRVGHRRREAEARAERLDRPLDDLAGRRALEPGGRPVEVQVGGGEGHSAS
jgi:hypothetical protein